MALRKKISKPIEHAVREECGQACANPKCRNWSTATHEIHHIDGNSSNSVADNLILLCGSCHNKVGAGLFSEADVRLWKRMATAGYLLPPMNSSSTVGGVDIEINNGIAGNNVRIDRVTIKREKGNKSSPLPGTIGADPDMRTYADYLVKRYIDWRKKGQKYDSRKFWAGGAHGILAEGFGSPSSVMHISRDRFFEWIAQAQAKIDNTVWGRNNSHRNYHSWEEHLNERKGKS